MPHSDEAEKGVLSCLLQSPERIAPNLHTMPPAMFYSASNREVFAILAELTAAGKPIELVSITHRLRNSGRLERAGGPSALTDLYTFVPSAAHFQFYLATLRELWSQRKHIEAHAQALDKLFAAKDGEVASVIETVKGLLEDAGRMPGQLLKSYTLAAALPGLLDEIEHRLANPGHLPGIRTGFETVDKKTGGMQPGQVWVFAGEPGDGKSTIMQNCAESAAIDGKKVRWYPLEMPRNEQMMRLLSSGAGVDNSKLATGEISRGEQQALSAAIRRMQGYNVELVEVEDATATDIFADVEKSDCDVVLIDYLQLMEDTSPRKSDTREGILASISRRQKRLARRTGKVILTASQLNDGGKLRESRSIGQDADKVFLIRKCRDDSQDGGNDDARRTLWCDKNRGGARHWGQEMRFLGSIFQFKEASE